MVGVVRRRGVLARVFGWVVRIGIVLVLLFAALLLLWRFVPPVSTLMAARWVTLRGVDRQWVPLERISPRLVASVITSEDARFCRHGGVDWDAINVVLDTDGGPTRGASTIAMQTTKNLFLWPSRSYIRKGLEVPLALVLDVAWPKRRVMEVYLNIAEWGDGVFGAEAAARRYFGKSAAALTAREAALLAAALPNPLARDPRKPPRRHAMLARIVERRAQAAGGLTDCLR